MRSTVVPAQITTIEDKIAGSLNFTQVFLLILPVFVAIILYAVFPPIMLLAWYKVWLVLVVTIISVGLAVRIKEKLVLDWLIVILRFLMRPGRYIVNKNDALSHDIVLPFTVEKLPAISLEKVKSTKLPIATPTVGDLAKLEQLIDADKLKLQFKSSKKGGLHVAFTQVQA